MTFSQESFEVFERSIADYHKADNVDTPIANPYKEKSIEFYLYLKNWIDTVQWHLEVIDIMNVLQRSIVFAIFI